MMEKTAYFDGHWGEGWPELTYIESRIIDAAGRAKYFERGQDGGSFFIEGPRGADNMMPQKGQLKTALYLHMNPDHGVKLQYSNWDGHQLVTYHSKGDLGRLDEFARSFHDTPLSLGLFVTFDMGCRAVKEFIETDGALPKSIEWIANGDLPPGTFPDP